MFTVTSKKNFSSLTKNENKKQEYSKQSKKYDIRKDGACVS